MGPTSTTSELDELQAQYEALPDKRTSEARELRAQIKELAEEEEPGSTRDESVVPPQAPAAAPQAQPPATSPPRPKKGLSDEERAVVPPLETIGAPIASKSALYWVGVLPFQQQREADPKTGRPAISGRRRPPKGTIDGIGGRVSFHIEHTPILHESSEPGQPPQRGKYPGEIVRLTEDQVSDLRRGLRSSLVRWRQREGRHAHGYVVRIPDPDTIEEVKDRLGLTDREVARLRVKHSQFEVNQTDEPVARFIYCVKVDHPEAREGGPWRPSLHLPPSVEEQGYIESP